VKFVVTTVHSSRLLGADFYAQSTCYCPEKQTFVGRFLSKVNLLLPGQADFWGPIFMHSQLATARTSRLLGADFYAQSTCYCPDKQTFGDRFLGTVNLLLPGQADFCGPIFTQSICYCPDKQTFGSWFLRTVNLLLPGQGLSIDTSEIKGLQHIAISGY